MWNSIKINSPVWTIFNNIFNVKRNNSIQRYFLANCSINQKFMQQSCRHSTKTLCDDENDEDQHLKDNKKNKIKEDNWKDKILWSTHFEDTFDDRSHYVKVYRNMQMSKNKESYAELKMMRQARCLPLALKYSDKDELKNIYLEEKLDSENYESQEINNLSNDEKSQYPFSIIKDLTKLNNEINKNNNEDKPRLGRQPRIAHKENSSDENWYRDYGTPNPEIPRSKVPCGGCGAFLHCQDTSIPGYLPSESFEKRTEKGLSVTLCQRCYFLREHNAALSVNISPNDYIKTLRHIKNREALVLLLVDLLDFPCSIWPGIINIIGENRNVILVGNKVDLLPKDSDYYLSHVAEALNSTAQNFGLNRARILHTSLISATTGYGIEDLITSIQQKWRDKGDVYIMGCTNVGKSSLFNAFLQSDLCRVQAVDLVQRATISQWPGTTLNLLKFPLMRSDGWKIRMRKIRLDNLKKEEELEKLQKNETLGIVHSTLIGKIGRTFASQKRIRQITTTDKNDDIFSIDYTKPLDERQLFQKGDWNSNDPKWKDCKWCYDTPGAVNENQLLDMLTLEELIKISPKSVIIPRSYCLKVGMTLFLGGLARIDFIEGQSAVKLIAFASNAIPITIVKTKDAEEVYNKGLGTEILGVPMKSTDSRLEEFPALKEQIIKIVGIGDSECSGDIVVSSAGWISVSGNVGVSHILKVHTPDGKGIFHRTPPLLPYTIRLKGNRIRDTPAYNENKPFIS